MLLKTDIYHIKKSRLRRRKCAKHNKSA